jgi:hypothetical protein
MPFSHEMIWFQLGMLWDANFLSIFKTCRDISRPIRFLVDFS